LKHNLSAEINLQRMPIQLCDITVVKYKVKWIFIYLHFSADILEFDSIILANALSD